MKIPKVVFASMFLFVTVAGAAPTPQNVVIPDETETLIACKLEDPPKSTEVPVFTTPKEAEHTRGLYHYKLWLPKGYSADAQKSWPCMFVMSPSGDAEMGPMKNYLQNNGYIVILLVEARNGAWPKIVGNFLAAHDDVTQRVRILEGKKYATGFSGGARGSSVFVQLRPGFSGLLLQGAGAAETREGTYHVNGIKRNPSLNVAMTMGADDKNKSEVEKMKMVLGVAHFNSFEFDGAHRWAPPETFNNAMAWLVEKGAAKPAAAKSSSFDELFKKK